MTPYREKFVVAALIGYIASHVQILELENGVAKQIWFRETTQKCSYPELTVNLVNLPWLENGRVQTPCKPSVAGE